jgi:hypothetical protein
MNTDQPQPLQLAKQTGLWVLIVYETKDFLLAVHGPYASRAHAREWLPAAMKQINEAKGGHVDEVPLWQPEHAGRP